MSGGLGKREGRRDSTWRRDVPVASDEDGNVSAARDEDVAFPNGGAVGKVDGEPSTARDEDVAFPRDSAFPRVSASAKEGATAFGNATSPSRATPNVSFSTAIPVSVALPAPDPRAFFSPSANIDRTRGGNLPHWHQARKLQFITFRLADSLPREKLLRLAEEKEIFLSRKNEMTDEEIAGFHEWFDARTEAYLSAGHGSCILKDASVRKIVEKAILFSDGEKCRVHAFVIMPNHVHLLVEMMGETPVHDFLKALKSFTAHQINKARKTSGSVWMKESFDRMIRNEKHYRRTIEYIKRNAEACPRDSICYMACVRKADGEGSVARDEDVAFPSGVAGKADWEPSTVRDGDVAFPSGGGAGRVDGEGPAARDGDVAFPRVCAFPRVYAFPRVCAFPRDFAFPRVCASVKEGVTAFGNATSSSRATKPVNNPLPETTTSPSRAVEIEHSL